MEKHTDQKTKKMLFQLVAFALILGAALLYFKDVFGWVSWVWEIFLPLIFGCCIAFILNLPMNWLETKVYTKERFKGKAAGARRPLAILTTVLILLLIVVGVIWVIVPQLSNSLKMLGESIPGTITKLTIWLDELAVKYPQLQGTVDSITGSSAEVGQNLTDYLKNGLGETLTTTYTAAMSVLGQVLTFFIGFMFSFYILGAKEKLGRQNRELLYSMFSEKTANRILYICHLTYNSFQAFVYGQCMEALVLFAMYVAVALIFRLPYSMMIAVMIGVLSLIPLFGAWIGWGIGCILIATVNPAQVITFSLIFFIISQIEGNFIYPNIVGTRMDFPGIWVLAAVTVGGNMMGIIGMIIAVPIAAVVYTLIKIWKNNRLADKNIPPETYLKAPDWSEYDAGKEFAEAKAKLKKKPVD